MIILPLIKHLSFKVYKAVFAGSDEHSDKLKGDIEKKIFQEKKKRFSLPYQSNVSKY